MENKDKIKFELYFESAPHVLEEGKDKEYRVSTTIEAHIFEKDFGSGIIGADLGIHAFRYPGKKRPERVSLSDLQKNDAQEIYKLDGFLFHLDVITFYRFPGADRLLKTGGPEFRRQVFISRDRYQDQENYKHIKNVIKSIVDNLWKDIQPAREEWLKEEEMKP